MHRAGLLLASLGLCLLAALPVSAAERTVYLVNIGWHVGIAIPVDKTLRRALPEISAFPDADFIEIGWGDEDFYRAEDPGNMTALRAALTPTEAVVHLHGFSNPVADRFPRSEILELKLSDEEFAGLFGHVHASFQRSGDGGSSEALGPGLYGSESSRFYKGTGKFHLLNTCNTWVAEALAEAGLDVDPEGIVTATSLMQAARTAIADRRAASQ
ncbi:MAG: DUF2459 domain-containing protein [Alphaproteobacteria bacterium]|nr:DUF2459 domain-containing protein [Alphaproteobacteria bacterium]